MSDGQFADVSTPDEAHPEHPSGSLGQSVYDRILQDLISLSIRPGARMTVDALARQFNVSQTPVREALSRLETEDLVVKTHLRGYRAAARLTLNEFEDLYDIRLLLEPYAARRAAESRSPEQLQIMQHLDAEMIKRIDPTDDVSNYRKFAALDAKLHDVVAEASGNQLVRSSLARLHTHLHIFRLTISRRLTDEAAEEHGVLIAAIGRRDGNVAEAAMRSHIERSRLRLLTAFT